MPFMISIYLLPNYVRNLKVGGENLLEHTYII